MFLIALLPIRGSAQSDTLRSNKTITNMRMVGVGTASVLDTYLSQENYNGPEITYLSHTTREAEDGRWSKQLVHQGRFAYLNNRAGNGRELSGDYTFEYSLLYGWKLLQNKLMLRAGGMADAHVGFLYNTRNSNNPAQAKAQLSIAAAVSANYRFRLCKSHHHVRYELSVPLAGLVFSPNYGQSYYEIFSRGNYDHNIVPTYPGNMPSLRQMVTIDFNLLHSTFCIGYLGNYQQAKVNNLKYHHYSHTFIIGVVKKFQLIKIRP